MDDNALAYVHLAVVYGRCAGAVPAGTDVGLVTDGRTRGIAVYISVAAFFAEGHYNNMDIVLLALVLWTLAIEALMLREPTVPHAIFIFADKGASDQHQDYRGALVGLVFLGKLLLRR